MLGKGWFPAQLGGLNRCYRELLLRLPEARGIVVGPATGAPPSVVGVSRHEAPLARRLVALALAARRLRRGVGAVDAHFALYAWPALLPGGLARCPLVVHFQGPWADESVVAGDGSALRHALRTALERRVYRRAARVIVLSSAFRRIAVERYGVRPWVVRVVPPGVDLERFVPGDRATARAQLGLDEGTFVAVCVRRLVERMGLDALIDAWAAVAGTLPPGATLLIAGDGPAAASLAEHARGTEGAGGVRLLGRVDDEELPALYQAADVAVVPSRALEGFGLVVLEAAACGTPSIVTAVGGLPEAVDPLDPSLVVPANDDAALADRIAAAAGGALPSRAAARAFAEARSWERAAERTREVVADAVGARADGRLRVVYLDHVARLSGGEIALARLLRELPGVDPHVILGENGPLADVLVRQGVSTEVLPLPSAARDLPRRHVGVRLPPGAVALSAIHVLRLAARLRRLRPDVVHANSLKAGVYGCAAARLAGVPVVWHVRDRLAPDYLPPTARRLVRWMTRTLADHVVANSATTAATLDPRCRTTVLPSLVRVADARPRVGGSRGGEPPRIGIVGRLAPWKGQGLLLDAFAAAFPPGRSEVRCAIVGGALFGEHEYAAGLREQALRLGVADRVELRGHRPDVWSELARLDVLVHASSIPEPFGQVVLEGMAAGLPVVAADAGGPAELIEHDRNGVLVPPGDRTALAAALRELVADPGRRARIAAAGAATAAAHRPEEVAARLLDVYRSTAGRRREAV